MHYSPEQRAKIKFMFINKAMSALEISKEFNGKPSPQCILNWSRLINSEGRTWELEREEYEQHQYEKLAPQNLAEKILERINVVLSKSSKRFTTKDADALSKLQKVMEKLVNKKFQTPTMFYVLTRFGEFLSVNYKDLLKPELGLTNAIRHFKNVLKEEFEEIK